MLPKKSAVKVLNTLTYYRISVGTYLDRKQATSLLKELSDSKLVNPSWVSIDCKDGQCCIRMKAPLKNFEVEHFLSSKNLKLEEKNGFWLISKSPK